MSFSYRILGLTLTSDVALGSLVPAVGPAATGDAVTVGHTRAELPRELAELYTNMLPGTGEPVPYLTSSRCEGGYRLRFHGYADFFVTADGREIRVRAGEGVPASTVEQLLADLVLPRALQLFGRPCLHASAIALPSVGAVAFLGDSGRGKSTLCAALSEHGRMICDDCLALRVDEHEVTVSPSYPSVRLWADSAGVLVGSDAAALPFATPRLSKRRLARELTVEPLALRHVVLLEVDDAAPTPALDRLIGLAAVGALARGVLRIDPHDKGLLDAEFRLLTRLVASVAIHRLRFAHRFDQLDQLVDRVRSLGA